MKKVACFVLLNDAAVQTARDKNLYLTFSFFFFFVKILSRTNRNWRSAKCTFDLTFIDRDGVSTNAFFSGFILLFVFADCDHLPIVLYAIWSLEEERESERDSKNVEKIFTRIARCFFCFFSLELSTFLFHGLLLTRMDSLFFFFLFFWNSILSALSFWMYLFWTSSFDDTRYCDNETMIHSILLRRPDWSTPVNQCRYSAVPH